MNIYLLRSRTSGWDQYTGFTIAAPTAKEARALAQSMIAAEKETAPNYWLSNQWSSITKVGTAQGKTPKVLLSSFRNG